jgi:hypothetical protein
MPRFSFSLRRAGGEAEVEDLDLPDVESARREALLACGDLLREMDELPQTRTAWEMQVSTESGKPIAVIRFSAEVFAEE